MVIELLQALEKMARKHQVKGSSEPISCITMFTPEGIQVSAFEQQLRGRIVQLAESLEVEDCVQGVLQIMAKLRTEGLRNLWFERDDATNIGRALRSYMENQPQQVMTDILEYHILVFKTAGDNAWTMKRGPGETKVVPYLPSILEASSIGMSGEVCIGGEYLLPAEGHVSEEAKDLIEDFENWQEVSVLEYVNSCLPADKIVRLQGPTSQPIIPVKTTKDRKLLWRSAKDSDNQNGETVFQAESEDLYVRTYSDFRILYENLPERAWNMTLGQLLSEYKPLWQSDHSYVKAKESIDEATQVGPDSDHTVAGTQGIAAPQSIMLTNGRILKRRHNGTAVPLLLSGSTSKHGNQLMWTPWRFLEEVSGVQDEEETQEQKRIRLEVFPLSVFPYSGADSDENDDSDVEVD